MEMEMVVVAASHLPVRVVGEEQGSSLPVPCVGAAAEKNEGTEML